jgi:PLP dependent protein
MLTGPQNSAAAIARALAAVRERIAEAAAAAGRDPDSVTLLAVSKGQPVDAIQAAYEAGQRAFAENYVQEAEAKIEALTGLDITWHFIGQVQANKTRLIAEHFHWVHTVDRERVAIRLADQRPHYAPPLAVCLQVMLDPEPGKAGVEPASLPELLAAVSRLPRLALRGLMCIPRARGTPADENASFSRLARIRDVLRTPALPLDTLSMGMSADFEPAIAAGATIVRIGTAIFGERR